MADYPLGVWRSWNLDGATTGTNIGKAGTAVRVHTVHLVAGSTTPTNVTLFNCADVNGCNSTVNAYITVRAGLESSKVATFDSHAGILFPLGCYITTGAAISYVTVAFRNELI
jgi:hypothetical protein